MARASVPLTLIVSWEQLGDGLPITAQADQGRLLILLSSRTHTPPNIRSIS